MLIDSGQTAHVRRLGNIRAKYIPPEIIGLICESFIEVHTEKYAKEMRDLVRFRESGPYGQERDEDRSRFVLCGGCYGCFAGGHREDLPSLCLTSKATASEARRVLYRDVSFLYDGYSFIEYDCRLPFDKLHHIETTWWSIEDIPKASCTAQLPSVRTLAIKHGWGPQMNHVPNWQAIPQTFPNLTDLRLIRCHFPQSSDISNLTDNCPNLQSLRLVAAEKRR
jgi:hypothetical protein